VDMHCRPAALVALIYVDGLYPALPSGMQVDEPFFVTGPEIPPRQDRSGLRKRGLTPGPRRLLEGWDNVLSREEKGDQGENGGSRKCQADP